MILLQINHASSNEPEIICEGCYETKDTFVFAWSSISGIGCYHWLRGPIHRMPYNGEANYLVRIIWHILNLL
jgi:hypothetical protein